MNNNIDIKTLEAFQDGNHKAFETIFITYYNKTKAFIDGYIKSEPDAEELTEDLFVNLWINRHSIDKFVGGMPEQRRMIYTLSRNEGLSNAEIAERLNTTKRNVESQLSLALKEIRKVISCFLVSLL